MPGTNLKPEFNGETGRYDYIEVPESVPAPNNNFKKLKDGVSATINGVSETVAGCIGLSYDALDSIGGIMNALSAGYCKLIRVDRPTHIPAIQNLGSPSVTSSDPK